MAQDKCLVGTGMAWAMSMPIGQTTPRSFATRRVIELGLDPATMLACSLARRGLIPEAPRLHLNAAGGGG